LNAGTLWLTQRFEGEPVDLVFTTETGGLVSRQHVDALLRHTAVKIGIDPRHLGTHVGRRTVVTTLCMNGAELADIARHVGHANPATTAGYVTALGDRPQRTASLAASLLDTAP
jgi:site-specific recombinase XerD